MTTRRKTWRCFHCDELFRSRTQRLSSESLRVSGGTK